jgi:hypothetical protein
VEKMMDISVGKVVEGLYLDGEHEIRGTIIDSSYVPTFLRNEMEQVFLVKLHHVLFIGEKYQSCVVVSKSDILNVLGDDESFEEFTDDDLRIA